MLEFLYSIDVAIFFFINHTLANPVFDLIMPIVTDLNKQKPVILVIVLIVVWIMWKGGKKGRITIGLLIITVIISDQVNSTFLKEIFNRVRPCRVLDGVRMLVDCGGGKSFPSSHAVNNFAGAFIISHFYKSQRWYWYAFAAFVAFSRTYVGVHYPSDIVAGAFVGLGIGFTVIYLWIQIAQKAKITLE